MRTGELGFVAGKKCQIVIDLRKRNAGDKRKINIKNGDFGKLGCTGHKPAFDLQKAKEIPQVEKILIDRGAGMTLDRFMVS